jgi:hypothetical protein
VDVVSLYIDHILSTTEDPNDRPSPGWAADVGCALAKRHNATVYPSIRQAMLAGGTDLGVDAVLIIAEHGDYPWDEKGRHMYPCDSKRSTRRHDSLTHPPHPRWLTGHA